MADAVKEGETGNDAEKSLPVMYTSDGDGVSTIEAAAEPLTGLRAFLCKAATWGRVEIRGISPIPLADRTETRTINIFTLWWCMNANILPITFGMLGPEYGLGLRDCALVILFFTLLSTIIPAFLSILGPKLGMRQMIQARYSFGRYIISIPVLLNLATLTGFCVIMSVIGGQCLSAVADGSLSSAVGIVIVALLSLVISFCGFNVLHVYERYAWIPALVAIIVATGTGGSGLKKQAVTEPATAASVLDFGMIVASYMIPWACLASDFTTYLDPKTPSSKIFLYSYAGCAIPTILLMTLGSAMASAVANMPSWEAGYEAYNAGGLMAAMLEPAGGFGKFLVVVLSFTLLGNMAATSYSITLNFQMLIPVLFKVPRYIFAVVLTAIMIPVSIKAATDFFTNLNNFVALIGYWSSAFLSAVLVEHLYFRKGDCSLYDIEAWNTASLLPPGFAAIVAAVCSMGLVVPSMAQIWYTGPIAETTGDLGIEFALVVTAILYIPFRHLEKSIAGR